MPRICIHFHIHVPLPLNSFSFFDLGTHKSYIDHQSSIDKIQRFTIGTLIPSIRVLQNLIERNGDKFKFALSISGTTLDLMDVQAPDGLKALQQLTKTGGVEWLNYPYYHSLSFLFNRKEFSRQLALQRNRLEKFFGQVPQVLCNTHLIYNNYLAYYAKMHQYKGILCEGVPALLAPEIENELCKPTDVDGVSLLLRHAQLSEDISFRFSDTEWDSFPLTAANYAFWLSQARGSLVTLSMDFSTFEKHASRSLLSFFNYLPEEVWKYEGMTFLTPSEAISSLQARGTYNAFDSISWAWPDRGIRSWQSNPMQREALEKIYSLSDEVLQHSNKKILRNWSILQEADIFTRMKEIHSPSEDLLGSSYDIYSSFMNMLSDLKLQLRTE
ncbi:MAG: hypothetical protein AAGA10_00845 [Bacteroidota bacterium]